MITYIKGDLFDSPMGTLLVHSVNCQGVWGSGIAKTFKDHYLVEYKLYREYCSVMDNPLGTSLIINHIGCLFTSDNYGDLVDPPELILKNTQKALVQLLNTTKVQISMPKINSGLFKVPWEQTEKIIEQVSGQRNIFVYTNE